MTEPLKTAENAAPRGATAPELEHPWSTLERLMSDLEGDAVDNANACPSCSHPSCERRRARLPESRAALREFVELKGHKSDCGIREGKDCTCSPPFWGKPPVAAPQSESGPSPQDCDCADLWADLLARNGVECLGESYHRTGHPPDCPIAPPESGPSLEALLDELQIAFEERHAAGSERSAMRCVKARREILALFSRQEAELGKWRALACSKAWEFGTEVRKNDELSVRLSSSESALLRAKQELADALRRSP